MRPVFAAMLVLLVAGCSSAPTPEPRPVEPERLGALRLEATLGRSDGLARPIEALLVWRTFRSSWPSRPWLSVLLRDTQGGPIAEERFPLPDSSGGDPAVPTPVALAFEERRFPRSGPLGTLVVGLLGEGRQVYAVSRAERLTLIRDEDEEGRPRPFRVPSRSNGLHLPTEYDGLTAHAGPPGPFGWVAEATPDTLLARVRSPDPVTRCEALWVIAGATAESPPETLDLRPLCAGEPLRLAVEALAAPPDDGALRWPWEREAAVAASRALVELARSQ